VGEGGPSGTGVGVVSRVTIEEVEALGAKWIPRLRLSDWTIVFRVEDCSPAVGSCSTNWTKQMAFISIDDGMPGSFDGFAHGVRKGRGTEAVVLHELLHVLESPNKGDIREACGDDEDLDQKITDYRERLIDSVTRILLEAEYFEGAWA
jgi:hypothetical protein